MESQSDVNNAARRVIHRLLKGQFRGAAQLRAQAARASLSSLASSGGPVFEFHHSGSVALAEVSHPVPVEAEGEDLDGTTIHFLLHAPSGLLRQLEVFREDGGPIQRWPADDLLIVLVNSSV